MLVAVLQTQVSLLPLLRHLRVPLRLLRRQQLVQLRPRPFLLKVVVLMPSVRLQPRRCSQTADPSRMLRKPLVLLQLQQSLLLEAML